MNQIPVIAFAAAIPFAPHTQGIGRMEIPDQEVAETAAPFGVPQNFVFLPDEVRSAFLKQQYIAPSSADQSRVSFNIEIGDRTPAELTQELRRLSGLTWAQIANIFNVSKRAPYLWASGKTVSAENHRCLGEVVATLRFVDRGSSEENRNLLLSNAPNRQTYLELIKKGQYSLVSEYAGKGIGRLDIGQDLTNDGMKFNAPVHFGQAIEAAVGANESEILPRNPPKLRRVKARPKKA